jgi:predicted phage baseplate assembly protein
MATVLPLPDLDDRRWADLIDEARALIPFYAPGWTDHNVHDPGITLLELFAWVAEMDLYGVNRITDAHRRNFLALAGITLAPPAPATTILALQLARGAPALALPSGLEFTGHEPFGTPVRFRARHGLTAQPGLLAAVLSGDGAGAALRDLTTPWSRGEPIQPFGPDPGTGAALYLGFDLPAPWPPGTPLSLGLAVADDRSGPGERDRIAAEAAGADADCAPPWEAAGPLPAPRSLRPRHHDAVLRWELRTGAGHWTALGPDDVGDDTRAMTLSGRVVLRMPAPAPAGALSPRPEPLTWLRVRLIRGAFDAPPVVVGPVANAVVVEQAVPAVAQLQLAPNAQVTGTPPAPGGLTGLDLDLDRGGAVLRIAFAPVDAERAAARLLAFDGASLSVEVAAAARATGGAAQRVEIPDAPFVAGSLQVSSREDGVWRRWTPRPDFDASTRSDAHVVADPTAGTVTLGDGEHGRTATAGAPLLVTADLTRGAAGNLAAGAIDRLADSPHNRAAVDLDGLGAQLADITNIVPAAGGAVAETVTAAIARAREGREQVARAVTLDDYTELARQTPGVRLARAAAFANTHPGFGCQRAPGVVTVLILPHLPADRPVPSPGLRRAVSAHLNRRRVIGTRVEVAEPRYVTVTVRATVTALPGMRTGDVADAVRRALHRFLHPLTGGPDGTGWPFGRDVYRSEVLAVIDEVPGVAHVHALELLSGDGPASCANLCLGPTGLVDAGPHEIDVR